MEGQPSLSSEEVILQVDENNKEVGPVKRGVARKENLWHRASYIFITNSQRQFYV